MTISTSPHPINQAVLNQILYDLQNGRLRRCKSTGLTDEELEALMRPEIVSILLNSPVSWCDIKINRDVLQRLLHRANSLEHEVAMIDRMLVLEASSEMIYQFYGIPHQELAIRRSLLGLPKRRGRHPTLSEHEENALWKVWKKEYSHRQIALSDEMNMLLLTLDLAEQFKLPASVIWLAIKSWIDQKLI